MWNIILGIVVLTVIYLYKDGCLKLFKYLKFQYKFWILYAWLTIMTAALIPIFALRPKNVKNTVLLAKGTKLGNNLVGIKWQLRNSEFLSDDRGAVIVANHQSGVDLLGFGNVWHAVHRGAVVSKKEMLYVGTIGLALYLVGTIFIDRKRPQEAHKELQIKADKSFKDKIKIWIFPEGTRNKDMSKLLPFKKGAFIMAVQSQVPIIPIVYSPHYFINKTKQIFNKGNVIIQCLEPISTEGLTMEDVPELTERVHNIMNDTYKELLREARSSLPPDYPIDIRDSEN